MIEFVAPAVLSALAGLVSSLVASYAKARLAERDKSHGSVKYEINGNESVTVPEASDAKTLQERVEALARISPSIAVLDGWSMIASAILNRAQESLGAEIDASQNLVQIARSLPEIKPETLLRIERLRAARNLVAHSAEHLTSATVKSAVEDIVPALRALDARYRANEAA